MTHVTCRLTAKKQDQLRNPTLGNRVWAAYFFVRGAMSRGAVVQSPSPPQPGLMHSLITGLYYKVTARKYGRTASVTLRAKRSVKRRTVRVKFARARTLVL